MGRGGGVVLQNKKTMKYNSKEKTTRKLVINRSKDPWQQRRQFEQLHSLTEHQRQSQEVFVYFLPKELITHMVLFSWEQANADAIQNFDTVNFSGSLSE